MFPCSSRVTFSAIFAIQNVILCKHICNVALYDVFLYASHIAVLHYREPWRAITVILSVQLTLTLLIRQKQYSTHILQSYTNQTVIVFLLAITNSSKSYSQSVKFFNLLLYFTYHPSRLQSHFPQRNHPSVYSCAPSSCCPPPPSPPVSPGRLSASC